VGPTAGLEAVKVNISILAGNELLFAARQFRNPVTSPIELTKRKRSVKSFCVRNLSPSDRHFVTKFPVGYLNQYHVH
jgi:hypothetical protein